MALQKNLKFSNTMNIPWGQTGSQSLTLMLALKGALKAGLHTTIKLASTISWSITLTLAWLWPWSDPNLNSQCTKNLGDLANVRLIRQEHRRKRCQLQLRGCCWSAYAYWNPQTLATLWAYPWGQTGSWSLTLILAFNLPFRACLHPAIV